MLAKQDPKISEQIDLLKRILAAKFSIKKIYIFGSHAYGKPGKASDIDLCIIADLTGRRKIELLNEIRRALFDSIHVPLDILVYSEKEFNSRASLKSTLEYKIQNTGLKIHG